jgi:membrane-associated phospholipid phosphatase
MHALNPAETARTDDAPSPQTVRRSIAWLVLSAASFVVFLVLLILVEAHISRGADRSVELDIHRDFGVRTFTFFDAVSFVGGTIVRAALLVVLTALLLRGRYVWTAGFLLTAQVGSFLGQVAKILVARPRPHLFPGALHAAGYSYPSGHALSATLFCGALAYLLWAHFRARPAMVVLPMALVICAFLIGLSRIVLGVHYPTDVEGGIALGLAWLYATVAVLGPGVRREIQARGT